MGSGPGPESFQRKIFRLARRPDARPLADGRRTGCAEEVEKPNNPQREAPDLEQIGGFAVSLQNQFFILKDCFYTEALRDRLDEASATIRNRGHGANS